MERLEMKNLRGKFEVRGRPTSWPISVRGWKEIHKNYKFLHTAGREFHIPARQLTSECLLDQMKG